MSPSLVISPECVETFQSLKLDRKIKYIIYKLNEEYTEIVVEKASNSQSYEEFTADLPKAECRWAVYDFEFEQEAGETSHTMCFYLWSPTDATVKSKMVYATSKIGLRRSLVGITADIQGTDYNEVAHDTVRDKVLHST